MLLPSVELVSAERYIRTTAAHGSIAEQQQHMVVLPNNSSTW